MRKFLLLVLCGFIFIFLIILWWRENSRAPSDQSTKVSFLIPKGTSATVIGLNLEEKELIRNSLAFKIYVQVTGKQKSIKAGEYNLTKNLSLFKVVEILTSGPDEIWITIPEGLRKEEIAEKYVLGLGKSGDEEDSFRSEFLALAQNEEGYLFPDTYLFAPSVTAKTVVTKMKDLFEKQVDTEIRSDIVKSGRSLEDVLILASLLERETKTEDEKPLVAGVIYKRLLASWPLQIDASVQYAIANQKLKNQKTNEIKYWETLTSADLTIDSLYNLYKYQGLPPTAICNPGLSSIRAATYPQDSDFWFYLHDSSGQIHYAETLEEHNQNVARYLR